MKITLNGQQHELSGPISIAELLEQENLANRRVAVEVNLEIVPRSQHGETFLSDNDRVEIVHAIGGG